MSIAATEDVEMLRSEMQDEIRQVRREMDQLRRLLQAPPGGRTPPRSPAERRASLDRMRKLREMILDERGGELLPPLAEEISAMREERGAHFVGE